MGEYLDGVALKVCRAHLHFCELDAEIRSWFNSYAYEVPPEDDEDDWIAFRLQIKSNLPPTLPVLVGDVVHNLRSALDHLIWQSCVINDAPPGGHLKFPVCLTEGAWLRDVEERDIAERGKGPIDGLGDHAAFLVKSAQPYVGRNETQARKTALAWLNWLSNRDKHRYVHAATAVASHKRFGVEFNPPDAVTGVEFEPLVEVGTPIQSDSKIARVRATRLTEVEPNVKLNMSLGVVFSERGLPLAGLGAIEWVVSEIVRRFAQEVFWEGVTLPDLSGPPDPIVLEGH